MKQETGLAIAFGVAMLAFMIMMLFIPMQKPLNNSKDDYCQQCIEQEKQELKESLLFLNDLNQGLHFLDEEGCEWRIVIEPATAYTNCKQNQVAEK